MLRKIYVNDLEFYKSLGVTINIPTPDGLQEIGDVIIKEEECDRVFLDNGEIISVAHNHLFLTKEGWKKEKDITSDDVLIGENNKDVKILHKDGIGIRKVYDFEVLHENHRYYSKGVISHNSSKTLISTLAALCRVAGTHANQRYSKIIVSRPNIPVNKQWSIGYVKGDADEKMKHWLSGFTSNLEFLYDSRYSSDDGKDRPSEIVWREYFQPQALEAIQGASFNGKLLCLDETQLVDVDTLQQIMTRTANGSKLVLLLDPNQTYGANRGNEGYKRILPHVKGNPLVSYVNLQNIYRSELTAFVAEIFKGN